MTLFGSFPRTRARVRPPHALSAPLFLLLAALFFPAAQIKAQSVKARPVARMIARTVSAPTSLPNEAPRITSAACAARALYAHASSASEFAATSPERHAFDLVNREREARGEARLVWDDELASMARRHSENMAGQNFFSHTDPAGRDAAAGAGAGCGWRALAENIAYNQGFDDPVAFAVERWMNSAKHRDNILRAGFTHAGLGIAKSPDGTLYFTQVFVTR
jgi:uncharacterized protein YkwD